MGGTKRKGGAAPAAASAPVSEADAAYTAWLSESGISLNGVGIARFARTGRGCVAQRDIAPGEVVVEVPDDKVILAETGAASAALEGCGMSPEEARESPRLQREVGG